MKTLRYPLVAALAAGIISAAPAGAVDDTKPSPACWGLAFTDKKGDQASQAPGAQEAPRENLDMTGGFYKYDKAKGEEAATFNLQIANLSTDIPPGATAISWYVSAGAAAGDTWVRALTDFTGIVSYEYGHYEIVGPQTQSVRDGSTQGAFFEGADGVIQIVLPADADGKPGTVHKTKTVTAYEARQVLPGASPTPAKGGLLYEVDVAATKQNWTVGEPCPATAPAAPAPSTQSTTTTTQSLNAGAAPLPVKVSSTKFKAAKVRKSMALKLSSTETITNLGAQLKKGSKVVGKGKLAKLAGKGTLKLKISKKLKKGKYVLDLAGTDSSGARRFTVAKITVR